MLLTIRYAEYSPIRITVPDMGLDPREWAMAAFAATRIPLTNQYGVPGALEVAAALADMHTREHGRVVPALSEGDRVVAGDQVVTLLAINHTGTDAWSLPEPSFSPPAPVAPPPAGPVMYVSAQQPPPDVVAYAEDARDRLWTGKGAGMWRCLTDPAGRTEAGMWSVVWVEYGPMVPLVPVQVATEPDGPEWSAPHRAPLPGPDARNSLRHPST